MDLNKTMERIDRVMNEKKKDVLLWEEVLVEVQSLQEQLTKEKECNRDFWEKNKSLQEQNKKLVDFLLDPMMPGKYSNEIRFNRDVYNILYHELLKEAAPEPQPKGKS